MNSQELCRPNYNLEHLDLGNQWWVEDIFASGWSFVLSSNICSSSLQKPFFCFCKLPLSSKLVSLCSRAIIICRERRKENSLQTSTAKSFLEVKTPSGRRSRCHFSAIPELSTVGCAATPSCGHTAPMLHRRSKNKLAGCFNDDITSFFRRWEEDNGFLRRVWKPDNNFLSSLFFLLSLVWKLFIFFFLSCPPSGKLCCPSRTPAGCRFRSRNNSQADYTGSPAPSIKPLIAPPLRLHGHVALWGLHCLCHWFCSKSEHDLRQRALAAKNQRRRGHFLQISDLKRLSVVWMQDCGSG